MGSIAEITAAGNYAYHSSKAALNAAMKGLSWALAERSIGVLLRTGNERPLLSLQRNRIPW